MEASLVQGDCHIFFPGSNHAYGEAVVSRLIDLVGVSGDALTTLCWLPQALNAIRAMETRALLLPAMAAFTGGVGPWLIYGLAINDWPLIGSKCRDVGAEGGDPGDEIALRLSGARNRSPVQDKSADPSGNQRKHDDATAMPDQHDDARIADVIKTQAKISQRGHCQRRQR
jgi:MtN3 and saliva related transmembrane protein